MIPRIHIWQAYRQCPISARLRVFGRGVLCPYHALLGWFPSCGRILDVGCGDGLLLFLLSHHSRSGAATYVGIDPAQDKIDNAAAALGGRVELKVGQVSVLPDESFDCVSIMDVLYLIPLKDWSALLSHAVRVLRPGGRLIVKEVINRPFWKSWIVYLEELVAIKLLSMTLGQSPHLESMETYRTAIAQVGVELVQVKMVDTGYPAAHCLFVARKC